MFGQGMFAGQWFAASCCCHEEPPPTPSGRPGGPGDMDRRADWRERLEDDDDVAMITALLDL